MIWSPQLVLYHLYAESHHTHSSAHNSYQHTLCTCLAALQATSAANDVLGFSQTEDHSNGKVFGLVDKALGLVTKIPGVQEPVVVAGTAKP